MHWIRIWYNYQRINYHECDHIASFCLKMETWESVPHFWVSASSFVSSCPDEIISWSGVMEPKIKITTILGSSTSLNDAYTDGSCFDIVALERENSQNLSISKNYSKSKSLQGRITIFPSTFSFVVFCLVYCALWQIWNGFQIVSYF